MSQTAENYLQDFSPPAPSRSAARVKKLRAMMQKNSLDGFIIPRANAHQGEYVAAQDERLAWISGFTGSAGMAVILTDKAAIFTDGRYQIQVAQQSDQNIFTCHHITTAPPSAWLADNLPDKARLGFDPWLHTISQIETLKKALGETQLIPCEPNIVDAIWDDRPPPPNAEVMAHDLAYAGCEAAQKCAQAADQLKQKKENAFILTEPTSIAWLLNIRGRDVPHMPVVLCFAILYENENVDLFIDPQRVPSDVQKTLGARLHIKPPAAFRTALDGLGKSIVRLSKTQTAVWIFNRLQMCGAKINFDADPCLLPKAIKNRAEIDGARNAHIRDGAALTQFLCWLDETAPKQNIDEITAVKKLEAFRRTQNLFQDISFDTISGSGPNGAIVHYRVTEPTNRTLRDGELFLVDSGAQYLDGTTDVTRTIAIGAPAAEMRKNFCLVLKGHIALASAVFPEGTSGHQLDALARKPLWEAGLDFDHGTGHGVGSFLSVHEGPQAISPRGSPVPLKPGMIISNEPGYYKKNAYGIRIENLVAVQRRDDLNQDDRKMLGFETLTCAPIDLNLVDPALLETHEINWLNVYHDHVRHVLTPLVDAHTAAWLKHATREI